jgi:hypothetical protein
MAEIVLLVLITVGVVIMFSPRGQRYSDAVQILGGAAEVFGVNIGLIALIFFIGSLVENAVPSVGMLLLYSLMGIGLLQLIYVIPRVLFLKRQARWAKMKGVIIGAVIVALLNGGCWFILGSVRFH